jgi:predicted  nucleic acid-binding Zn-ribbon protein
MPRVSPMSFERPMAVPDDLEDSGLSGGDSTLNRLKLGTAWSCATLAGVSALTYSAISQTSPMLTTLVLVILLASYAGYGYFLQPKNSVQFPDSLYYMGFLWALFALIAHFVIWPAPKLTTDAVLTTFGYALVTTFCGMLLRLVIIQFQDTLPDRLVQAQDTIDRRVAALTQQINEATMEITAFRDRAASDLGGTLSDLVQSLTDLRENIAEQHLTMAKLMTSSFESSLREILGRLSAIQVPQEILRAEVTKLVSALGKQGEGFEKAAQRLETSLLEAAETVTAFGNSLHGSEAATAVGTAINELSSKVKARTEQFVEMTTALEKSRSELDGQLNSLQSLRSAVSTVSAQLSVFETELRELSSTSMSAEVRNGLMNVQKAINSSLEASKAIESTMRGVLFFMKERATEEHSSGRN